MGLNSTIYGRLLMDRFDVVGLICFCMLIVMLFAEYMELLE